MWDHEDSFDGFDWEDIALAGALAEEMAAEVRERQWLPSKYNLRRLPANSSENSGKAARIALS